MQEEQARLLVEHVAVQGRDLNAVGTQGADHWIDFWCCKDEVASDCSLSISCWLKVDTGGNPERASGVERHYALGDVVAPGNAKLIDAADGLTFDADNAIQLCCVETNVGAGGRSGRNDQRSFARGKGCVQGVC